MITSKQQDEIAEALALRHDSVHVIGNDSKLVRSVRVECIGPRAEYLITSTGAAIRQLPRVYRTGNGETIA